MNCIEVNEKMADLFDNKVSQELKAEFIAHFAVCPDCKNLFTEMSAVMEELKPRITIRAGKELQSRILGQAISSGNPYQTRRLRIFPGMSPGLKRITAIALLLLILFILLPLFNHTGWMQNKASAANSIFGRSIIAMTGIKTVYMELKVRTIENENFDYIDMNAEFMPYKLWKVFGNPPKWRIEKPGRTIVMDGKNQYLYASGPSGFAIMGNPDDGLIDWMKILLDPEKILQTEKEITAENNAKYQIENGNVIILTVNAKAMGDFRNDYALNKTIPESNNRRVYTFDKSTNLLKSLEVFVEAGSKEILVLQLTTLKYDEPIADNKFVIDLPPNVKWVTLDSIISNKNTGLAGVGSEKATKIFFEALQQKDWKIVDQLMPGFLESSDIEKLKESFGGITILSIGKSFKSGQYPGEFVPYEVRLKSGVIKKMNLALRNDNKYKKWIIDGGF